MIVRVNYIEMQKNNISDLDLHQQKMFYIEVDGDKTLDFLIDEALSQLAWGGSGRWFHIQSMEIFRTWNI